MLKEKTISYSDNTVGLLYKVENKFYENAGTVTFEKGPNI